MITKREISVRKSVSWWSKMYNLLFILVYHHPPFFLHQSFTTFNCFCRKFSLGAIKTISSAYKSILTFMPPASTPQFRFSTSTAKSFINMLNNVGDNVHHVLHQTLYQIYLFYNWWFSHMPLSCCTKKRWHYTFYLWYQIDSVFWRTTSLGQPNQRPFSYQ